MRKDKAASPKKRTNNRKRSLRPPTFDLKKTTSDKTDPDPDLYINLITSPNIIFLYEFTYGAKRHEIDTLMRGFQVQLKRAKTPEEKMKARTWITIAESAWAKARVGRIKRFDKRTGKTLEEVVKKARGSSDRSIFQLIEFGKEWLFAPYVKARILRATPEEDGNFFDLLGEAVKRKTGWLEDIPGREQEKQKNLRRLIRHLQLVKFDFTNKNAPQGILHIIDQLPNEGGADLPIPESPQVIRRTLRRMDIVG